MYAKQGNQQGRRTPLSLNAGGAATGGAKHHHDQQQQHHQQQAHYKGKAAAANGSGSNTMSAKNDNKSTTQQKTEPTLAELKKQHILEKKQQQQQLQQQQQQQQNMSESSKKSGEKNNDEKRTQNGNSAKNSGNTKEKQTQNGNETLNNSEVLKDKAADKEKVVEKNEKIEKVEKNQKPSKEDKKEKIIEVNEKETEKKTEGKQEKAAKNDGEKTAITSSSSIENNTNSAGILPPPAKTTSEKEKKNLTPNKSAEKPQKTTTPIKEKTEKVVAPTVNPVVLLTSIDVEMEPVILDKSPMKSTPLEAVVVSNAIPTATSTPGQVTTAKRSTTVKSDIQLAMQTGGGLSPDRSNCPRTFTQISGRRSIRPLNEFAPTHYRESYRRINTELDVTSITNTSLNVTVGSEVPNNSSFSFFGRGRKRDRTPPLQSAMELQHDVDVSPPKRVRLDMQGFFSAVASPLTLLRSRFSKTSLQSSTPVKLSSKLTTEDEGEVQNVSGISIHEEMPADISETDDITATEEITVGNKLENDDADASAERNESAATEHQIDAKCDLEKSTTSIDIDGVDAVADDSSLKIKVTPIAGGDSLAKNKRCHIM